MAAQLAPPCGNFSGILEDCNTRSEAESSARFIAEMVMTMAMTMKAMATHRRTTIRDLFGPAYGKPIQQSWWRHLVNDKTLNLADELY